MWIAAACLSALFAGITAILYKCGVKTSSNVATAIRTTVVLVFAWAIVFITGAYSAIGLITPKSWIFLILSGLATGASWLCYFKALSVGEVCKVAAVDKSSVVLSVLFAIILFQNERTALEIKLPCLALIAVGTFLMTDLKPSKNESEDRKSLSWLFFALLSALFAAATSLLAKIGIENVDSNTATAIRTAVVFVFAWAIVIGKGELKLVKEISRKETLFLVLSGIATGSSWLCYYYAIRQGLVSVVVPIDKLSILITVLFSTLFFKEKLSKKAWAGLALLTVGTVAMAIFA